MSDEKNVKPADKVAVKDAARGNGGPIGAISEHAINAQARPTDDGDRKTVKPGSEDRIFTADSKDKWDTDQPTLGDLLASSRKIEAAQVAAAKKANK